MHVQRSELSKREDATEASKSSWVAWPVPVLVAAVLCVVAASAAGGAATGEPVPIPGTHVALIVPPGFELAERFPGLAREEAGASVMVAELPAPYAEIVGGFTDDTLAARGLVVRNREAVEIAGREATLIHSSQAAAGTTFRKWLAVFGDREGTVLLTATAPASLAGELEAALRSTVLGARWDRARAADPYAAFGYRIDETANLKFAHQTPQGLVLLPPGIEVGVPGEHRMLVLGRSLREVGIDDLAAFARRRLAQIEQLSDLVEVSGREVRCGGLEGYEIVALGRDDGREVVVYQVLLVDGDDYVRMVGTAAPENRNAAVAEFRRVAASVHKEGPDYSLALTCESDRLLLGTTVDCALSIEGYVPSGLGGTVTPAAQRSLVPGARFGRGRAGFFLPFAYEADRPGEVELGPSSLEFEGRVLTSNRLVLRVLEPPADDAPVGIAAMPARVAVGQAFDLVVVERGVVQGGLRAVSSVRVGGKPVLAVAKPGPVVTLVGKDALEVEPGPSVTTRETGGETERVSFYRAVARRPGRLTIDAGFLEGLDGETEVSPATVDGVAGE